MVPRKDMRRYQYCWRCGEEYLAVDADGVDRLSQTYGARICPNCYAETKASRLPALDARIRAGDEVGMAHLYHEGYPCHDCGALKGELHEVGCDAEECPTCRAQLLSCGHGGRWWGEGVAAQYGGQ